MPIANVSAAHDGPGTIHLTGVLDSHSAEALCSEHVLLSAKVVSLERTQGGGIAYDFQVDMDEQTWKDQQVAATASAAQRATEQLTADSKAEEQADARKEAAADAKLANVVAAAVKSALASADTSK